MKITNVKTHPYSHYNTFYWLDGDKVITFYCSSGIRLTEERDVIHTIKYDSISYPNKCTANSFSITLPRFNKPFGFINNKLYYLTTFSQSFSQTKKRYLVERNIFDNSEKQVSCFENSDLQLLYNKNSSWVFNKEHNVLLCFDFKRNIILKEINLSKLKFIPDDIQLNNNNIILLNTNSNNSLVVCQDKQLHHINHNIHTPIYVTDKAYYLQLNESYHELVINDFKQLPQIIRLPYKSWNDPVDIIANNDTVLILFRKSLVKFNLSEKKFTKIKLPKDLSFVSFLINTNCSNIGVSTLSGDIFIFDFLTHSSITTTKSNIGIDL